MAWDITIAELRLGLLALLSWDAVAAIAAVAAVAAAILVAGARRREARRMAAIKISAIRKIGERALSAINAFLHYDTVTDGKFNWESGRTRALHERIPVVRASIDQLRNIDILNLPVSEVIPFVQELPDDLEDLIESLSDYVGSTRSSRSQHETRARELLDRLHFHIESIALIEEQLL